MKIRPVGAELFHAKYGRTYMMKPIAALSNVASAPKNQVFFFWDPHETHNKLWGRNVEFIFARARFRKKKTPR